MRKHRLFSALFSAVIGVACVTAPFLYKSDRLFINKLTTDAAESEDTWTSSDGYYYEINTVRKTASFLGYVGYEEELVIPPTITAYINDIYPIECTVTTFAPSISNQGHTDKIQKVTIPGTVKTLQHFAFRLNWNSLEEVVLEDGVETIESYAFDGAGNMVSLTIPASVKSIDTNPFWNAMYEGNEYSRKGVIQGYTGSYAEKFAKYKGIPFISIGEVSPDTTTSADDDPVEQTVTTVAENLPDLEVPVSAITLKESEQYTITANQDNLTYKSNDTDVAVVSKKGIITALGEGSAVISVINGDGDVVQIKVTVTSEKTTEPIEEIKYGDANGDNNVTISDAVAILQSISNADKYPLSEQGKINADVDGVAGVTGKDAAVIQLFDARVITELPIK